MLIYVAMEASAPFRGLGLAVVLPDINSIYTSPTDR